MISSECEEMTQKLDVLALNVFQEEISFYPMWPLLRTRIWILLALDYTEEERKKYVVLVRSKRWDGFPQWKSMWSLTPNLEEGEDVGEEMLFSPSISFKFPSFPGRHPLSGFTAERAQFYPRALALPPTLLWTYYNNGHLPKLIEVIFKAALMVRYICHHPCLRLRKVKYFAKDPVDG